MPVLRQIGARKHAERRADRDADHRHDQAADDRIEETPDDCRAAAVFLVKTSSDKPPNPFQISVTRMMTNMLRPKTVAAYARPIQITLRRLRPE